MSSLWPFPLFRNYPTDPVLSELFLTFVREGFEVAKNSSDELHLCGPMGDLRFWNENRWYAWACRGTFTPLGETVPSMAWRDFMPSRWALRQMRGLRECCNAAAGVDASRGGEQC